MNKDNKPISFKIVETIGVSIINVRGLIFLESLTDEELFAYLNKQKYIDEVIEELQKRGFKITKEDIVFL